MERLSYAAAGVDIAAADAAKVAMGPSLATTDPRVLNGLGAFATLFAASFPGYDQPVLVLKIEEPGSKQQLAFQHGRVEAIAQDLVNHLVNDVITTGATPLAVQDAIICGKLEPTVVTQIVASLADACRAQGCTLTGGETSEQPGVLDAGAYVLVASALGVVDRARVIDGARIAVGDRLVALAANGLHTNGYSLVRALIARQPAILQELIGGEPFLDAILRPHRCYYQSLRDLFPLPALHGIAHITGGGIAGNLRRVLPSTVNAAVDLDRIAILPIFRRIREWGGVDDAEMLRTFNLGVGMILVVAPDPAETVHAHLAGYDCDSYEIGAIVPGSGDVVLEGQLRW